MKFTPITVSNFKLPIQKGSRHRFPFNDKRLGDQWEKLSKAISDCSSIVINQISKTTNEAFGYYRFLRNNAVNVMELIHLNCKIKREQLKGRHVLSIGDTSTYNLKTHMGRIQDIERIGVIEDNKTAGFFTHVHIAVNATTQDIIGLSDILIWCRKKSSKKSTSKLFQERESFKWVEGAKNSQKVLSAADMITHVLDSDADSFEVFEHLISLGDEFVIRTHHNRQVFWQDAANEQKTSKVKECLNKNSLLGVYEIDLPALNFYSKTHGKQIQRKARTAKIEVRSCQVKILLPSQLKNTAAQPLDLWLVQAKEVTENLAEGVIPIQWNLMTTHACHTFEKARQVIGFYDNRWMVEQLFRTMKTKGFNLEATELETFDGILKQTVMAYQAATKVLQLVYARNKADAQPIEEVFDKEEQKVLKYVNEQYEGNTLKQKNPFSPTQTSWATWIVARLGGWKGYQSQRLPGPITLKRGLDKLATFIEAHRIFNST